MAVNFLRPPPIRKHGPKYAKYATATAKKNRAFRSVFDSRKKYGKTLLTPLAGASVEVAPEEARRP